MQTLPVFQRILSMRLRPLLPLLLLTLIAARGDAQNFEVDVYDPIEVGTSPSQVVADTAHDLLHVLSSGVDRDYDGVLEPGDGDVAATWHVIDRDNNLVDSMSFGTFFNSYPVRAAFDFDGGRLYAPVDGVIRAYDIGSMEPVTDTVVDIDGAAVTWDPVRQLMVVSTRADDFSSPGTTWYVEPDEGVVLARVLAGANPADGFVTDLDEVTGVSRTFTMNEGSGSGDASISMVGLSGDIYGGGDESIRFGGGAEQGILHGDQVYFSLTSASLVRVLDASTHADVAGSPVAVPGEPLIYGIDVDDDWLAVIAENGGLFVYDNTTLALLYKIKVPGTARRVAIGDGRLYVAGPVNSKGVPQTVITVAETDSTTRTIDVGSMPSNLWSLGNDRLLVIGEDNGADEGWWSVIDVESGEAIRGGTIPKKNFNGGIRAAFNRDEMKLGVLTSPELLEIDITTDSAEPTIVWNPEDAFADRVVAADGLWYLANFPGDLVPEFGWVYGVEVGTGRELGRVATTISIPILPVPAHSTVEGAGAFYAIPTPGYGGNDPDLVYVEHHRNIFEGELGTLANHISRGKSHCFEELMTMVTLSGSHEVVMLENMGGNPTIGLRTPTGTSAFDGPRATVPAPCVPAIYCGAVLTSTYSGEILLLYNGSVVDRANLPGRGEGLALFGDSVYAASVLETGTFDSPLRSLSPVFVQWPSSVPGELLSADLLTTSPSPVVDRMQIRLSLKEPGEVSTTLLDMQGRTVLSSTPEHLEAGTGTIELSLGGLPVGAYLLHVDTPFGNGVRIVRVVR